ncbi:MAG: hypothetical protein BIFFINMI_02496 [Phycisphaerae bacterium]|nr:hypothetical protein [Phycisphaerae bacterium]
MGFPYQKPYDEDCELTHYVWCHCWHLMTKNELEVGRAAQILEQAAVAKSEGMKKALTKLSRRDEDPLIAAELRNGIDLFRRKVRERVLREHPTEANINRCPKCSRIVRTPKARHCYWCGNDWH